jgi:PadR family transcriptional regulator, regulatory protein PadR
MEPVDASFPAQLRRGVLEYCVLALIEAKPVYGLDIARALHEPGILESEGTLYPLLSRLRSRGLVETTWAESTTGPPRRYYELTAHGVAALAAFRTDWGRFRSAVDSLIGEQK